MQLLAARVAIVTGASSGIGRATAKLFASEGAKLVVGRADAMSSTASLPRSSGPAGALLRIGLTQTLAAEHGAQGVRVNALLPGGTDTPMGRVVANSPEALAFVASLHALKRIAQPEEIARSALYLASDDSSFTTGTALLADGGVSICRG